MYGKILDAEAIRIAQMVKMSLYELYGIYGMECPINGEFSD